MKTWDIEEIIENAKNHSPYYRELYKDIKYKKLSDLPPVDSSKFWNEEVLTSQSPSGLVFKSGGSTGSPKHSYFTNQEWESFTAFFGWGMSQGILESNDRVANLFYVGDMYASFLFIKDSLQSISATEMPMSHFPIGGATKNEQVLKTLNDFSINVVAGVPTALLALFEEFKDNRALYPKIKIEKILFGGEGLYPDQEKSFKNIFPDIEIASIGLASVDGGLLGYITPDCKSGEHRVFDGATIIEIVNPDTLEVITEKNIPGKVLLTNLTRKLMPIIRYPAGDMAIWIDDVNRASRKFCLQGRADEGARLGTVTVLFEEVRSILQTCLPEITAIQFQMVVNHFDGKDQLVIRVAAEVEKIKTDKILMVFAQEKKPYMDCLQKNLIHPIEIEFIEMSKLDKNERTGKLKRIIDRR
jgi:phenylacetate-CoA ligase